MIIINYCKQNGKHGYSYNTSNDIVSSISQVAPGIMKNSFIPGAVIGVIQNGKQEDILTFGYENKNNMTRITNDTQFQVGSISKTLTAWGVMKLVEAGNINLDDPVETYLSRWHLPSSEFDHERVTIRALLSHTAGLSIDGYIGTKNGREIKTLEESLSSSRNGKQTGVSLIFNPGTAFRYSGGGYTLLQLLIEEVTELPFFRYMDDEVLRPLGMSNSTFEWENKRCSKMSTGYSTFGNRLPDYVYTEKAAAGLITTVSDFIKFLYANFEGTYGELPGRGVIKPDTVQLMQSRINENTPYGLGYFVIPIDENKYVMHRGGNRGWHSHFAIFPDKKSAIILMSNASNGRNLSNEIMRLWIQNVISVSDSNIFRSMKLLKTNPLINFIKYYYFILTHR